MTEDVAIKELIGAGLATVIERCHAASYNRGWWRDQEKDVPLLVKDGMPPSMEKYVKCTKLLLTVSELSEAMEGLRTDAQDDKLPEFTMETVEIADILIRLFDYIGAYELPVIEALLKKIDFNAARVDHDPATRKAKGGKKF